jgi:hypothetical protein
MFCGCSHLKAVWVFHSVGLASPDTGWPLGIISSREKYRTSVLKKMDLDFSSMAITRLPAVQNQHREAPKRLPVGWGSRKGQDSVLRLIRFGIKWSQLFTDKVLVPAGSRPRDVVERNLEWFRHYLPASTGALRFISPARSLKARSMWAESRKLARLPSRRWMASMISRCSLGMRAR